MASTRNDTETPYLLAPVSQEEEELFGRLALDRLPSHIAVIMDGNGRWAKKRGFAARIFGHRAGIDSVRTITRSCASLRLKGLTLYSFSKENWARPAAEVNALMDMLDKFLIDEVPELMENNVRLVASGDLEDLRPKTMKTLEGTMEKTRGNTGLTLNLALSYSSRTEIVRATKALVEKVQRGELTSDQIEPEHISQHLDHAELGDPDLLIRTSGEMRVSNFLLWQIAYAEFVITPVLWPDFKRPELLKALLEYQSRDRRFGGVR